MDKDKLNDMASNDRWLFEHSIKGFVDVQGLSRETGLDIRAGYVKGIQTQASSYFIHHYYPKPFLPGVKPVVVASVASGTAFRIMVGIRGLDGRAIPDHRGFSVHFTEFRDPGGPTKFLGDQWAAYIAIAGGA